MGAAPKAFLPLGGEPLLLKSARAFEAAPSVGSIVAVVPAADVCARDLLARLPKARRGRGRRRAPPGLGARGLAAGARRVRRRRARARRGPSLRGPEALIEAVARPARRQRARHCPCSPSWTPSSGCERAAWSRPSTAPSSAPPRRRKGSAWTSWPAPTRSLPRPGDADRRGGGARADRAPVAAVPGSARNRKITTPEDLAWAEDLLAAGRPERGLEPTGRARASTLTGWRRAGPSMLGGVAHSLRPGLKATRTGTA